MNLNACPAECPLCGQVISFAPRSGGINGQIAVCGQCGTTLIKQGPFKEISPDYSFRLKEKGDIDCPTPNCSGVLRFSIKGANGWHCSDCLLSMTKADQHRLKK